MKPDPDSPGAATIEQMLADLTSCLVTQREALVRGDLNALRAAQGQLQDAVQRNGLGQPIQPIDPRQREGLRQALRDALRLCTINAQLTGRAEAGVRRAQAALGQAEVALYGSGGHALQPAPRGGRRLGA